MKRLLTLLFALLTVSLLCAAASASYYDAAAEELSAIGMFRGTEDGFELDRAPTRAEAAIMLVRLYGAEEQAKAAYAAGEITHPFADVNRFNSPYVAWLYDNGLTRGVSDTAFGSAQLCSMQNYAAFLLRALGYEDGVDFAYRDVLTFAESCGFYEPSLLSASGFLRDDLAAMTYQALAADTKSGGSLLESLIERGAIDKGAAAGLTEWIDTYRALRRAGENLNANAIDMDVTTKLGMTMLVGGAREVSSTISTGSAQIVYRGGKLKMAYEAHTSMDAGPAMDMGMWVRDGWLYTAIGSDGQEQKSKVRIEDEQALLSRLTVGESAALNVSALSAIDSLNTKKTGVNTVYTAVLNKDATVRAIDGLGLLFGGNAPLLELSDITAEYTVDAQGRLRSVHMRFSAAMTMESEPDEQESTAAMKVDYHYDTALTIRATGTSVRVSYPDLSGFVEVDGAQSA